MRHPKVKALLSVLLLAVLLGSAPVLAQTGVLLAGQLQDLITRIERNRMPWVMMQADVRVRFVTSDQKTAACTSRLAYQRLEEKILLECYNDENQLLFTFRTEDKLFELYLPTRGALFRGNIFDLEDDPNIDSHLKPLDLYRALSPMMIPVEQTQVQDWNRNHAVLGIYRKAQNGMILSRRILTSQGGDIQTETFYSPEEKPTTVIHRSEFRQVEPAPEDPYRIRVSYPYRISIESKIRPTQTILMFDQIRFLPGDAGKVWTINYPEETKILNFENPLTRQADSAA